MLRRGAPLTAALLLVALAAAPGARAQGQPIAVYGNWCGPNHSGPAPPIDAIDAACQRHDMCYAAAVANAGGNRNAEEAAKCRCDNEINAEVQGIRASANYPNFPQFAQQTVEGIISVFSVKCTVVALANTVKDVWAAVKNG